MAAEHEEHFPNYLLIWFILLLLTASSIVATLLVTNFAPFLDMALLAFLFILGVIKAALVVANFMHLKFEAKYLWVLGLISLFFVGFFLAGTFFDLTATEKKGAPKPEPSHVEEPATHSMFFWIDQ